MRTSKPRDSRNADLAKIHIARKQLRLDDDTYRAMLHTVARVTSSKDLDEAGRRAVLEHLQARGFKTARGKTAFPGRPHNADSSPQILKIEAILTKGRKPWAYADAIAQRMFQVERVAWCNPAQLQGLIAALEAARRRHAASPKEAGNV